MKNLYKSSAEECITRVIWADVPNIIGNKLSSTDKPLRLESAKNELKDYVLDELKDLEDKVDLVKVGEAFNADEDSEEVLTNRNGRIVLKEKMKGGNNDEKIVVKNGKVKIKRGWLRKPDLKVKDTNKNKVFDSEDLIRHNNDERYKAKPEVAKEETEASKAYTKDIDALETSISETTDEKTLSKQKTKLEALRKSISENTEISDEEKKALLTRVDALIKSLESSVEKKSELFKEYEAKITELESKLTGKDALSAEELKTLKEDVEKLRTEIANNKDEILTEKERAALTKKLDALVKAIEAREAEPANKEKADASKKAYEDAEKAIEEINDDLSIEDTEAIEKAKQAVITAGPVLEEAKGKCAGFPEAVKLPELEKRFTEKKNKVDIFSNSAKEYKEIQKYQKKNDAELKKMDEEVNNEVKKLQDQLKDVTSPENLKVSPLDLEPADPTTYEDIPKGMMRHRIESLKLVEETNCLQRCSQNFAQKVAELEEKKSEFSFKNIARFAISAPVALMAMPIDLGLKFAGSEKRTSDIFPNKEVEKVRADKKVFQENFTEKSNKIDEKKVKLDEYGNTLKTNSGNLRETALDKARAGIQENVINQVPAGVDITSEPYLELIAKLDSEAESRIRPAVNQLDQQVMESVPEVTEATDLATDGLEASRQYIEDLKIVSPTALDMSVGFLTKNVAKGLDAVGGVLAKVPVIGIAGGVLRAAGGLVEGVGTMVTDPDKVGKGFASLLGFRGGEEAKEAWKGMASGLLGGEAWEDTIALWKEGKYFAALGEGSAALGEGTANIAATFFTGGAVAGVRGFGLAGKMGSIGAKITVGTTRIARVMPKGITSVAKTVGRRVAKVGKYGAKAGDLALAPMRVGLRPLRVLGKTGRKVEGALARGLAPTRWSKLGQLKYLRARKAKLLKDSRFWRDKAGAAKTEALAKEFTKRSEKLAKRANKIDVSGEIIRTPKPNKKVTTKSTSPKKSFSDRFKKKSSAEKNKTTKTEAKTKPKASKKTKTDQPKGKTEGTSKGHEKQREALAKEQAKLKKTVDRAEKFLEDIAKDKAEVMAKMRGTKPKTTETLPAIRSKADITKIKNDAIVAKTKYESAYRKAVQDGGGMTGLKNRMKPLRKVQKKAKEAEAAFNAAKKDIPVAPRVTSNPTQAALPQATAVPPGVSFKKLRGTVVPLTILGKDQKKRDIENITGDIEDQIAAAEKAKITPFSKETKTEKPETPEAEK